MSPLTKERGRAPRWCIGRLGAVLALVLGVVGGLAVPAAAHAELQSTTPVAGDVVGRSPGQVVLHFGEAVEISFGSVRVFDASSHRVDSGNASHPGADSHAVAVNLSASLPAGGYVVTWRVISADSHPVHRAFTFTVGTGAGGSAALRNEASGLLSKTRGSRAVGVIFGAVRFAAFAALAVLIGGGLFAIAIWPGARVDRRARALLWWALGAALAATVAGYALQGPYGGGLSISAAFEPSVLRSVWHTRYGLVYVARLVLLAIAMPLLARLLGRGDDRPGAPLVVGAGLVATALLATPGLAGHAGSGSLVALAVPFDVVHLGGAAIWFGGLVMIVTAVLPASRGEGGGPTSAMRVALPRFSEWALGAVIAIAVSGAFAAWRQIGTFAAVTTTAFGRLVLAKTVVFVVVVGLAAASRSIVHGDIALPRVRPRRSSTESRDAVAVLSHAVRSEGQGQGALSQGHGVRSEGQGALSQGPGAMAADRDVGTAPRLRRAISGEAGLIAVVLALTAVLVNAQPARSAYARPFSTEVHAGPDLVDVTIDPAKAGPLAFHVYVLSADGAQLDVPEVQAAMSQPAVGIDGLEVPLAKAGPGHFNVYGFDVPVRGAWSVRLRVRVNDIDEYVAAPFTVHVR